MDTNGAITGATSTVEASHSVSIETNVDQVNSSPAATGDQVEQIVVASESVTKVSNSIVVIKLQSNCTDQETKDDDIVKDEEASAKEDEQTETQEENGETVDAEDATEGSGEKEFTLQVGKNRGEADQYVKYLDQIDPSHRLRSLCKKGDVAGVKELLESEDPSLDINALSEEGWTCLHEIITHECQFTEVAKVLLSHGAEVNTQDIHGDSPLHSVLLYHNAENITLLLQNGVDFTLTNMVGRMPIHVVDDVETLKLLIDHGAKVSAQDKIGNSALHYAVVARDKERAQLLMQSGADVNIQNRSGSTPLHLSMELELAHMLLKSGANPNLPDLNANTPLHLAVRGRHKEIVKLMLDNGADSSLSNGAGKTPMNFAKDKEMKNILLGKASSSASSAVAASSTEAASTSGTVLVAKKASKKAAAASAPAHVFTPLIGADAALLKQCTSPSILKKRKRTFSDCDSPERPRVGPRLRFSEVNDYSGVEVVPVEKRVKVKPMYSEPQFSSDDD